MFQIRNIFLAVVFVFMYIALFKSQKSDSNYTPITGAIFDVDSSTQVFLQEKAKDVTDVIPSNVLFTDDTRLPTLYVYSDLILPEKFTAKTVKNKSLADFIVISEKFLEQKFVYKPELEKTLPSITSTVSVPVPEIQKKKVKKVKEEEKKVEIAKTTKPVPTEKIAKQEQSKQHAKLEQQEIVFSQHTLRNIVKESQKTYFYPDRKTSTKNVQLTVISYTPHKDKSIIKFSVSNSQQKYFFIATVSVLSDEKPIVDSEVFFEQFVPPQQTIEGYAVIPKTSKRNLVLQILESAGDKRCLEITFLTP